MSLKYTDPSLVTAIATDATVRPNPYAMGYGPKIPAARRVRYGNRWHRVYVMQWSNAGTAYIVSRGENLVIDIRTEHRFAATAWTNADDNSRWWESAHDGLFLIFDTSAHVNGGTPFVSPDEVREHVEKCEDCRATGVDVTDHGNGTATVEHL